METALLQSHWSKLQNQQIQRTQKTENYKRQEIEKSLQEPEHAVGKPQEPEGGDKRDSDQRGPKIELNCQSIVILFTLIATFGLLAIGSALDLTLLSVTYACTENPNIDCYPRLIDDTEDKGLNITTDKPTDDCSFWNSEGVSDKVTFVCYQFVLNVELFLAVIGGLSTVFAFTMRLTIGALLSISVHLKGKYAKCTRALFVGFTILMEPLLAIVGMVLQATGTNIDSTNDTPGVIFLATHSAEILLVFGIIATLLWLPWEDYAKEHRK